MVKYDFSGMKGKVCVITGGAGVIGATLAEGYSAAGCKVAIADLSKEAADKVAADIAGRTKNAVIGIQANVLDKVSLGKANEEIKSRLGMIDILINCAGGNSPKATTAKEFIEKGDLGELAGTFFGLELEGFDKIFDLNFKGTILPTMVFSRDMVNASGGAILNISSMNSFRPLTKIPAYSAAKASINNFTQWLAVHMAKVNVRVNAVAPGFFVTNQNRFLLTDEKTGQLTPRGNKIINGTPMGKFGEPADLVGTALFLTSDLSKFITGVIIPVDGGFSAYSGV